MAGRQHRGRFPIGVWGASIGVVALLLTTATRYGIHRDELYFLVAGRRLDWGYVDQPPLTPLLARLSELVAGTTPFAIRILPALAAGAIALVAAAIARRLGGGPVAQVFAAFSAGWIGVVLGEGHLLSTATFDYLFWAVGLLILVSILDGASPRWWLAFGATIGIGMQNKYTIAFFALATLVAIVASDRRRILAGPMPWLGAGLALLIALPNLAWQASHQWPQSELAAALRNRSDGSLAFVLFQPALLSIALTVPAAIGFWRLARSAGLRQWRPIATMFGILFVFFLATGGKAYYVAPMYTVLLAAGALWFESLHRRGRSFMAGSAVAGIAIGLFIALPLLPRSSFEAMDFTGELRETLGWPELVAQVAGVRDQLPVAERDDITIITSSYGEAGAIDILGSELGLPPAVSGHNNYWLWGPPEDHGAIVAVGHLGDLLSQICPVTVSRQTISNPWEVDNEEFGAPLLLCREPTGQLSDIWDSARHYN